MEQHQRRTRVRSQLQDAALLCTFTIAFMALALIACTTNQAASPAFSSNSTPTFVSQESAGATHDAEKLATREQMRNGQEETMTMAVLNHETPIIVPFPATYTPGPPPPSPTPVLGMLNSCQTISQYRYSFYNCWAGVVNGQMISTAAGVDIETMNTNRGVIVIYRGPYMTGSDNHPMVYNMPDEVGPAQINAVSGAMITLIPAGYIGYTPSVQTLTFDLATRQFLTASGTPIPTTPIPSPGP